MRIQGRPYGVLGPLLKVTRDDAWFFDTELLLLAEHNGLRVHEVPVDWVEDVDTRVDVVSTATDDLKGLWRMARLKASGAARVELPRRPAPAAEHPDAVLAPPTGRGVLSWEIGCAASVLVRLRERLGSTGFQAANLVFGNFDLSMTPSQTLLGADAVPVSVDMIRACTNAVAPLSEQRQDPDLSPLFADLRDLPTALFTVGTLDPFLDDSLFTHARWIAAGNEAEIVVYPGGGHVFTGAPIPLADQANDRIDAFLRQVGRGPKAPPTEVRRQ